MITLQKTPLLIKFITALSAFILLSCTSLIPQKEGPVEERLRAENRIMKQNLTLAIRENSVFKEENIQIRGENSGLKSRVRLLESEIKSLNRKHAEDISILNDKYGTLQKQKEILDKENVQKIDELKKINSSLEDKLSSEIARLTKEMREREEKFNRERLELETGFTGKELEYRREIAELKEKILTTGTDLESMKSRITEYEAKLSDTESGKRKLNDTINSLQSEIESLKKKTDKTPDEKHGK